MTSNFERQFLLIRSAVILAVILLIIGLLAPMLTMSQFYFFENSFSVVGGVWSLILEGQVLLAGIIALFSIVLPFAKLVVIFMATFENISEKRSRILKSMHEYGRWAMLDVMVVAVLIVTVKLGAVASIEIHWGLYIFALAVVLIMYLTHWVVKLDNG